MAYFLGVDTGGTYTDAVIVDEAATQVIGKAKSLTTRRDLALGIGRALLAALGPQAVGADRALAGLHPGAHQEQAHFRARGVAAGVQRPVQGAAGPVGQALDHAFDVVAQAGAGRWLAGRQGGLGRAGWCSRAGRCARGGLGQQGRCRWWCLGTRWCRRGVGRGRQPRDLRHLHGARPRRRDRHRRHGLCHGLRCR